MLKTLIWEALNVHLGKGFSVTGHEKKGAKDPFGKESAKGNERHRTVLNIRGGHVKSGL